MSLAAILNPRGTLKQLLLKYATDEVPLDLSAIVRKRLSEWSDNFLVSYLLLTSGRSNFVQFEKGWSVSWELVSSTEVDVMDALRGSAGGRVDVSNHLCLTVAFHAVRVVLREKRRQMLDLLSLTGARPGELLKLTTGMIDALVRRQSTSEMPDESVLFSDW